MMIFKRKSRKNRPDATTVTTAFSVCRAPLNGRRRWISKHACGQARSGRCAANAIQSLLFVFYIFLYSTGTQAESLSILYRPQCISITEESDRFKFFSLHEKGLERTAEQYDRVNVAYFSKWAAANGVSIKDGWTYMVDRYVNVLGAPISKKHMTLIFSERPCRSKCQGYAVLPRTKGTIVQPFSYRDHFVLMPDASNIAGDTDSVFWPSPDLVFRRYIFDVAEYAGKREEIQNEFYLIAFWDVYQASALRTMKHGGDASDRKPSSVAFSHSTFEHKFWAGGQMVYNLIAASHIAGCLRQFPETKTFWETVLD